jgi:hypothetical protein
MISHEGFHFFQAQSGIELGGNSGGFIGHMDQMANDELNSTDFSKSGGSYLFV